MPGISDIVLGTAPLAGGALLGASAGSLKAPDVRGLIRQDLDLLERIPPEQTQRRADLQRVIDQRIDDLIATADKSRTMRQAAASYQGNWRDIVVFICAILFTIIWWNVDHSRSNWLPMFIAMIVLSSIAGYYAARGGLRALQTFLHERRHHNRQDATG